MSSDSVDLLAFAPVDESVLEILAPGTGAPTGWAITFAGPSHPRTVAWSDERARRSLRRQGRIEAAQANGRKYKADDRDLDEVRRENVDSIVARILRWTPLKIGGEEIAFSPERATELLIDPRFSWVLGQCLEFLGDEASFTKGSPAA